MATHTRDYNKDIKSITITDELPTEIPNVITYNIKEIITSTTTADSYLPRTLNTLVNPPESKEVQFELIPNYTSRLNVVNYEYTETTGTITLNHYDTGVLTKNITIPTIDLNQ